MNAERVIFRIFFYTKSRLENLTYPFACPVVLLLSCPPCHPCLCESPHMLKEYRMSYSLPGTPRPVGRRAGQAQWCRVWYFGCSKHFLSNQEHDFKETERPDGHVWCKRNKSSTHSACDTDLSAAEKFWAWAFAGGVLIWL